MSTFTKLIVLLILGMTIKIVAHTTVDYSNGLKELIQTRINNRINILSLNS